MSVLSIGPISGIFNGAWARGNRKITLVTIFKLVHPIRYHNVALPRNVREFQTRHAGKSMSDAGNATGSISCASDDDDDASYNLGYAIASVFVVLLVSFVGFMTPILISDVGSKRGAKLAIVACGMAGTSVIIAIAFHIIGDGTTLLLNPCLVR
jgi:hypothetical protein